MQQHSDIGSELVRVLRNRRAHGIRFVELSEATRSAFFADLPKASAAASHSSAPAPKSLPESRNNVAADRQAPSRPEPAPTRPPSAVVHDPTDQAPVSSLDWEELEARAAVCRRCPLHTGRTNPVFGDGDRQARLMFIGEGPGRDEDLQGRPFVGKAGKLLDEMIEAMQFRREDVYIANIVKCRPSDNRNPEKDEAAACLPYLQRQIELIQPDVIVLLGAVALNVLLGLTGINRLHGQWQQYGAIPVLPTFHPSFLLRVQQKRREAWDDLKKAMEKLGKDPEETMRRIRSKQQ